jgi:hypothetical protein
VDLVGAEQWLSAPMHAGQHVGDAWLEAAAAAAGGAVLEQVEGAGLLHDMSVLDSPDHLLCLWAAPVVRLHYKLTPANR